MLNKVILVGRLTKDIELRSTPKGVSTCSFTLAVERNHQNAEGERETDFINCVAWRGAAEFISKFFQKGSMICVEGSIQTRNWKDNEGNNRYGTDIVIDRSYFVGGKKATDYVPVEAYSHEDDLPY